MKELTIELTPFCHLDCTHCSHDGMYEMQMDHPQFEDKEILQAINSLPEFKKIRWSGGEPLSNYSSQQLLRLLDKLKNRELQHSIFTSGIHDKDLDGKVIPIPENLIHQLKGLVTEIDFSIYGSRELHDRVTRTPGSYDALNKSLDMVRNAQIPFSFNFVAMRTTLEGLTDAVRYAVWKSHITPHSLELPKFRVLRFIKQGQGVECPQLALSTQQMADARQKVEELTQSYGDYVTIVPGCSFSEKECTQGTGKAVLTSRGNLVRCSALKSLEQQTDDKFPCRAYW